MRWSARACELGISDEHEGIILLEDDAPVGMPLADFMGDIVLEIDVLPNMARCLSMIGVAREVAAITGQTLKLPPADGAGDRPGDRRARSRWRSTTRSLSPRYAAGLIEGVKIGPAPGWMQRRLTYAGMRPINNIVDITNYVMLEWGQPLHAFDYDVLMKRAGGKAPTITVRPAKAGEMLKTLDGVERKLTPDMLVIADERRADRPGRRHGRGRDRGVGQDHEHPAGVGQLRLRQHSPHHEALDLPSEASMRFSRGIHPEMVPPPCPRQRPDAAIRRRHRREGRRRHLSGAAAAAGGRAEDVRSSPAAGRGSAASTSARASCGRWSSASRAIGNDAIKATVPPHRLDIQEGAGRPDRGSRPASRLRPPAGHAVERPVAAAGEQRAVAFEEKCATGLCRWACRKSSPTR